jgi:uncharacterized protein YbaR (Trm112 family)
MDRKLLDVLACPTTRQPLMPLGRGRLDALNAAISAGTLRRADGQAPAGPLDAGLVTADGRIAYRVDDGIPVLLPGEAFNLSELPGE